MDYFAWGQVDAPSLQRGGWGYWANYGWADNSNTGYSVLGLRYAEADLYGFKCIIPQVVKDEHNFWINFIQRPDGGSDYDGTWGWSNLLRTGNLLLEMSFYGDNTATPRVQNAIGYIQNNWVGGTNSQEMYCLMKGFQSLGIDTITVGGNPVNWFDVFADYIIANQNPAGYWDTLGWGIDLDTVFCLLTLEKVSPPPPVDVVVDVPDCACDLAGYKVKVTYTVEMFVVDGKLEIYKDANLVDTIILDDFTGTATYTRDVPSDTPGPHSWKAIMDVIPVSDGTPGHAEDADTIKVCRTPQVGDIPDQKAPFVSFDLDDYLIPPPPPPPPPPGSPPPPTPLPIVWSAKAPPGWTVNIDKENVATVVPPEGACEPATIIFIASRNCCEGVVCRGGDKAVFNPDGTPPEVKCVEAVNPAGKNVPPAGKTTLPGAKGGQNEDGFYQLFAKDNCDPEPKIFIGCKDCGGPPPPFGPFKSGVIVKITQAPGAVPSIKKIGNDTDAVAWHITVPSDPAVIAVDKSGNIAKFPCFVPPPPK